MAESTLSLARDDLRKRVGLVLGYGTDPAKWDSVQLSQIDMCVLDGVREAYWPVKDGKPYEWSFMRVSQTFSTASGTSSYTMADSFWQIPEQVVVASGAGANLMEVIDPDSLIQIRTLEAAANATPLYAAFRPTSIPLSTSVSTRWECLLYPTPNATLTIQMHIAVSPDSIMAANNFPIGSAMFTQTLIASVMAIAEKYYSSSDTEGGDRQGVRKYQQAYAERLQATMAADNAIKQSAASWAITEPEYGTFLWFKRSCSIMLFQQPNLSVLKHAQSKECEANVRAGLIRFYAPPAIAEGESPWSWSFLIASATLAVTSGTATYDLPTDFATMSGEFNYVTSAADKPRMVRVSFDDINAMKAAGAGTGNSKYFCISQKASTGGATKSRYEVTFYPTCAISENYTYRYTRSPAALSSSATYPAGNELHAETMVAAMRSVCEERQQGNQGAEWQKFIQLLGSSVGVDRQLMQNGKAWDTGTEPVFGTFLWFKRAASICLFQQTNLSLLNHTQSRECDSVVRSGLARFFMPPAISEGDSSWSWTFLKGNATIALVNGTALYDLPTDFSTMEGDFAFVTAGADKLRINRVSYDDLMAMKASTVSTGNSKYFCINPKSSTGATSKSRYEVTFYPTPATSENVTYRYVRVQPELTTTNLYPLGPESHTETMVAAIRSVCEERSQQGSQGAEWQKFIALLGASVKNDKQLAEESSPTWNTNAVQYGSYRWMSRRVGEYLGYGANSATWSHFQTETVNDVVNRGVRQLQTVRDWSFLRYEGTLSLTSLTYIYALPVDLVPGSIKAFSFSGAQQQSVEVCGVDSILNRRAMEVDPSGAPKYAGIRSVASSTGELVQRQEVLFFPKPDASYTLKYHYKMLPPLLSDANPHPAGGESFAEAYLVSCRLIAATTKAGDIGPAVAEFDRAVEIAAKTDSGASESRDSYSTTALSMGTYEWFQQEIGLALTYGANPADWTFNQKMTVNSNIDRAHADFCAGYAVGARADSAHRWTFLNPETTITTSAPYSTGTVTVVAGVVTLASGTFPTWAANAWFSVGGAQYAVSTRDSNTQITLVDTTAAAAAGSIYTIYRRAYDFPANLHAIDGGMVSLNSGNCQVLRNVDARYIDETLPYSWECGIPQMFAATETAPGVSGVTHQFILKPIPDSVYQLRFRYSIGIPTFSAGMMCAGGSLHAQTILYCALANINPKMANAAQSRMSASIALDRSRQSEFIGIGGGSGYSSGYRNENNVTTYMGMEYQ